MQPSQHIAAQRTRHVSSGGYPPPGGGYTPPAAPGSPSWGTPPGGHGPPPAMTPWGVSPAAPYGIDPVTHLPFSDKQKLVAGLLQLLLPGVGRIYTGHTGIGIAQLATLLLCVGGIWGFIDALLILSGKVSDAQGRPLRD